MHHMWCFEASKPLIRCLEASKPLFDSTLIAVVAAAVKVQLTLKGWPAILLNAVPLIRWISAAMSCSFFNCFDTLGPAQAAPGECITHHKAVHELMHTNS